MLLRRMFNKGDITIPRSFRTTVGTGQANSLVTDVHLHTGGAGGATFSERNSGMGPFNTTFRERMASIVDAHAFWQILPRTLSNSQRYAARPCASHFFWFFCILISALWRYSSFGLYAERTSRTASCPARRSPINQRWCGMILPFS